MRKKTNVHGKLSKHRRSQTRKSECAERTWQIWEVTLTSELGGCTNIHATQRSLFSLQRYINKERAEKHLALCWIPKS